MLTSHDNVIATNNGSKPIFWKLDGREVGLPPGQAVTVPFEVVRINLGDPRSGEADRIATDGNEKVRINSRANELKRLNMLYGQGIRQQEEHRTVTLAEVAPDVTITTVAGDPVDTPITDPGGNNVQAVPVSLDTPDALAARVAQMQRDLDNLLAQKSALDNEPTDDAEVAEDAPTGLSTPAK